MIERMKKLTLLAVASERKALLKDLMLLGCVELKEQAATDEAFLLTSTGAADYNTAVRRACARLAAAGVRQIDYQSGVSTSLEAAIRRNMMGGLGLMVEQISQKNHDETTAFSGSISILAMIRRISISSNRIWLPR